jgi:hypothetical protein
MRELTQDTMASIRKTYKINPVDPDSGAQVIILEGHYHIHLGEVFALSNNNASAAAISIAFKTGSKELHAEYKWSSESKAHFQVLKAASWTTNTGTLIALDNRKLASTKTLGILEDKTGTPAFQANEKYLIDVTSPTGTEVKGLTEYCFSAKAFGGGEGRADGEIILAAATNYIFLLTSDDGAKGLGMNLSMYGITPAS